MADSIVLTAAEIFDLTKYQQPAKQLAELHRQGFSRARIARTGQVIVERAHYEAVSAGTFGIAAAGAESEIDPVFKAKMVERTKARQKK